MRTRRTPLAVAAALTFAACAGPRASAERNPDALGTNAGVIEGVVAEVDREAGTVSVQAGDTVRTVPLAADVVVQIDDFDASFEDVQEGQQIRAALAAGDVGVEAVQIQILNQAVPVEPEPAP
jgi:hypothetical protein